MASYGWHGCVFWYRSALNGRRIAIYLSITRGYRMTRQRALLKQATTAVVNAYGDRVYRTVAPPRGLDA